MPERELPVSRAARIAHERRFAALALAQFGFPDASYHLLTLSHVTKFRVAADTPYLLRIHLPNWHSFGMIASELAWLRALSEQTSLHVAEIFL